MFMQIVSLISLLPFTIAQMCLCDNAGVRSTGQNTYTCSSGCPASFPFKCIGSWGDAACFNSWNYALACNGPGDSWCALPYAPSILMTNMNGLLCPGPPVVPDQFSCRLGAACVAAGSFDLRTPQTAICTETCVEVELRVGTSSYNSKTVTASTDVTCPATVSAVNWLSGYMSSDKFAVRTSGLQVSVQRTDIPQGWTLDLRFQCCQSQRYRVRCRTGSPADCSIRVYDLGADPCSAYSPCGLLLVANGSYIDSKDDFNSCPLGWKLVAPRSLQDWAAVRNSFDDFPGWRIADVTKPTNGHDGSSAPMNSASRSQWATADGNSWYLRGTSYSEPSGDYTANCYLGFDNWNQLNLALGDQLTFNDVGCSFGATTYLCQPDGSTPAVVISCICPNGTPTVASGSGGTLCERTWVDCSSCDSEFALSAPAGLGSQTCQSVNQAICRQGSPANCSISVYNLGADACSAYSPCGLLQVTNGRYINSKDDVNSCPLGWKLFAPRSLEDWKTVKATVLDDYRWIVDVTKSTGGSDGSSQPMNSASRPQWVTSDDADWWLRSTSYSEPSGDYFANCYLELSAIPDFAAGGELTFNDRDCGWGGRKYLCQPDASAAVSCICPNGTPTSTSGAGGTLCERTWVDCSSCDSRYTLSAPAGLGSQICRRAGASCDPGFYKSNMNCVPNVCQCDRGVPVTGVACTSNGANMCSSCNPGFRKSNINCVPNVCQCDGGVPVTGVACTRNGANMCSSCNPGFHKSNINCVPNVCQCDGGVPVTGSACSSDGENMCSSCRVGYHITLGSNGMRQTCETSSGMRSPGASSVPSAISSPALAASPLPSVSSSPGLGALAEPLPASKSPASLMVQQLRPTPKSLMWAFNTLLLLITALMMTLLLVFWRTRTLQVLSPPKVLVFMTGCAVGLCGAYFLAFRNSAVVCPAYLYTRYVGFSLISSPLIVTHRLLLSAIAESARGSYKPAWSLQRSYLELGGLLLVELCILVATATMHGLGYWVWEQDPSGRCPANRPYLLLTAVYMAMLVVCSFYAFRVRKAPGIFNDAKETGLVAYNTLVLSSISVCLQGVQDTSNGWLLAQAMITYASFFGSLCIFFVPRLFMLKEELASLHGRTRVRQMVPGPRLVPDVSADSTGPTPAQQIVPALSQHESSATSNHRSTQHDGSAVSEVQLEQRSLNSVQTRQGNQKQESGPPQAETSVRVHNAGQTVAQQMGDALSHPEIQMTEYASPSVLRAEASKNGLSLVPEQSNSYTGVGMMIELSRVMHNSSFFETKSEIHANTIQDSHVDFVSTDPDPSDVHDVESSQADSEVNSNDITKAKQQQATMMTTETPETLLQSHSVELGPRTSSFGTDPRYFPPLQTVLPRVSLP